MSFQLAARSLKSRLHLSECKTSTLALVVLVIIVGATLLCAGVVQLVSNHAFAIEASGEGESEASTESVAEGSGLSDTQQVEDPAPSFIVVYVSGCVSAPGVYELEEGSRVAHVLELAGGSTNGAALESVNLARVLSDGEQVHIPSREDLASGLYSDSQSQGAASSGSAVRVNINTAGIEQLVTLDGIGESTARKIIEDRESNGSFASVEDIMRVSGIGQKKFEAIEDRICV